MKKKPSRNPKPVIHMINVGGQILHTAVWQTDTATDNRPVLFFNGIGANLEMVAPLGEMLHDRDVVVFDMPGIGCSPSARMPYRARTLTKWANRVLDHLGIGDVDVMGISWGGAAAQQFARDCPRRVKSLVLLATSAGMAMVPGNISAISRMASPRRYIDPQYLMKHFETLYGDNAGDGASDHITRIKPPSRRGYLYQLLAMMGWTSVHFLPFLKQPTLVMSGDRDHIVPLVNSRILQSLIPRATLKIVRGGGHLFAISRARQVIPLIRGFLDDHQGQTKTAA